MMSTSSEVNDLFSHGRLQMGDQYLVFWHFLELLQFAASVRKPYCTNDSFLLWEPSALYLNFLSILYLSRTRFYKCHQTLCVCLRITRATRRREPCKWRQVCRNSLMIIYTLENYDVANTPGH